MIANIALPLSSEPTFGLTLPMDRIKSFLFFGYPSGKEFFKISINWLEKFSGSFSIFAILRATLDSLPKCFISEELKSKFLRGEYFLKPLASAVGNNIYSTNTSGLDEQFPDVYDPGFLGAVPEEAAMLNEGNPCVDHGEIVCTIPQ